MKGFRFTLLVEHCFCHGKRVARSLSHFVRITIELKHIFIIVIIINIGIPSKILYATYNITTNANKFRLIWHSQNTNGRDWRKQWYEPNAKRYAHSYFFFWFLDGLTAETNFLHDMLAKEAISRKCIVPFRFINGCKMQTICSKCG